MQIKKEKKKNNNENYIFKTKEYCINAMIYVPFTFAFDNFT